MLVDGLVGDDVELTSVFEDADDDAVGDGSGVHNQMHQVVGRPLVSNPRERVLSSPARRPVEVAAAAA